MNVTKSLTECLNEIVGLRKIERENKLNTSINLFYSYLKEFNHEFFKRDLLKSFFNDDINERTQNRIIREIIKSLLVDDKIKKSSVEKKSKPFLRNRSLFCLDNGSYKVMMTKNGYYKTNFYIWGFDDHKKIPKRILVDSCPFGTTTDKDFDFSEILSRKGIKQQKVLSNSQKSLTITQQKNKEIVYLIC